jgi:hypothetical protein
MTTPLIYSKMIEAQEAFGAQGIQKKDKNAFQKFNYRSVDSTIAAANAIFSAVGIIAIPSTTDTNWIIREVQDKQGNPRTDFTLQANFTFTFYAADGSSVQTAQLPCANTSQDDSKLLGQVMSYAYKEALFKTFSIPVEGTEDVDSLNSDRNQGVTSKTVSSATKSPSQQIQAALATSGKPATFVKELLGTRKAAELSESEFSELIAKISEKEVA